MFGSYTPPSSGPSDALGLLSMLGDPTASKAKLEELVTQTNLHREAADKAFEAQKKLDSTTAEIKAAQDKLDSERQAFEEHKAEHLEEFKKHRKEIEENYSSIDLHENTLSERLRKAKELEELLQNREFSVSNREKNSENKERLLVAKEIELRRQEESLNKKLEQLKAIVN